MPYQEKLNRIKRSASDHRRLIISVICLALGIILIPIGASLLKPTTKVVTMEEEIDYTYCISYKSMANNQSQPCLEYLKNNPNCVCQHPFNITETLIGDIVLYYELESYDQTAASYENSRDDQQLSGHLSPKPAEQCGSFSYDEVGKPIAPCGEIADSMFTDVFSIRDTKTKKTLNVTSYGMIKDKGNYRNPKRNESETLESVFKDYAKPKSWNKNVWELDTENEHNNGFENEQFIGWMTTSMKRKPYFRFQQNKIEKGRYILRVEYNYPPNVYNGTRLITFVATTTITDNSSYGDGVACVVIGSIALALCAVVVIISVKEEGWMFFRKKSNTNP